MTLSIPVASDHVRTLKDPNRSQIRIVHALVQVNDLPQNMPLEPDPRVPKIKGPVIKKISESLKTNDGRFHLLNRGITVSARDIEFDNRRNVLKLDIPDKDSYGIIDGGHTYQAISQAIASADGSTSSNGQAKNNDDLAPFIDQFVHLEVLISVESDLADIAEARNFSVQLKAWTLAAYKDKFEWFLEAVGPDYRRHIKTSENDAEPVGILDLIQVMCAVNPSLFRDGTAAVEAYKNAGKCLEYFIDRDDSYAFRKLEPICRDVVRLYDHVRYNWKTAYNSEDETGKKGRLGARLVMQQRKRNRATMATYYFIDPKKGPIKGDLPVEKGFSIPVIASFRALLEEKRGKYHWYSDPFKFFDEHGNRLVKVIMAANDSIGNNPHVVGRDAQVYTALYSEVRRWYLEGKVATLENKSLSQ